MSAQQTSSKALAYCLSLARQGGYKRELSYILAGLCVWLGLIRIVRKAGSIKSWHIALATLITGLILLGLSAALAALTPVLYQLGKLPGYAIASFLLLALLGDLRRTGRRVLDQALANT